jgi:O-antigen/teichoic acid export membrane protein
MLTASTRTSRAVAGTITSILQYAFIILLQLLLAPVVLRIAGQEVLGAYSFLMQMVSWAALTDLGFGVAIGRNLAQAIGIDDHRQRFRTIFITGRTFYLASNLIFAAIILIMSWKLNSLISMSYSVESDARLSLILLAIWVAIRTPLSLYNDALIATQNLAAVNIIAAMGAAVRLILSLSMVMLGASIIGLMLANIIAEAATFVAGYMWYRKLYPEDRFGWGIPDRSLFRKMLGFGLTFMIIVVAGRLSASTDSIIVGYLYGASAVSIYYISQVPGTMFYQLIWKLTDNSAPALNELHARQVISQLTNAYLRLLRYSLLVVIPLALGIFAFNRSAITVWVGQAQYAGDMLTVSLSLFAVTQVIIHLNGIVLLAYGDIRVMSAFFLCAGIVKVIMAFWLGRIIGLQGVMIANAATDMPAFVYLSFRVWRLLGLSVCEVGRNAVLPALKSSVLPLLVLIVMLLKPPFATWPLFLLWVFIFTLTWAAGAWGVGALPAERVQLQFYVKSTLSLAFGKTSGL